MTKVKNGAPINVDANGVGASVFDTLTALAVSRNPVMFQQRDMPRKWNPELAMKFYNLRSLLWWLMRKILDPANGLDPSLPNDNRLRSELIAPKHTLQNGTMWKAENKEDVVDRLGHSTDDADSTILTLFNIWEEDVYDLIKAKPKPDDEVAKAIMGGNRRIGQIRMGESMNSNRWMSR